METQKNFWAGNLSFLRNRMGISQEDLSTKLSIGRKKLAALESGQTVNPLVEDIFRFSDFYKIAIDTLFKVDLSKLGELQLRELQSGSDIYLKGGKIRVLAITVDKENNENVEYVPLKAKAGYRAGFSDPQFIATLPKYYIPNLPKNKTYRIFPTTGDSMLPIPEGADVIGQFVTEVKNLKPDTACIVVLDSAGGDFVFKLVTPLDSGLLLRSMNPLYQPYEVHLSEVLEVWQFYAYTSTRLPETENLAAISSSLQRIESGIEHLMQKQGSKALHQT